MTKHEIKRGIWEHYKGNRYRVIGMVTHSETLEPMVVYRALYGDGETWVRPASMWHETVLLPDGERPRFRLIREEEKHSLC